jgi:magnesium transporter
MKNSEIILNWLIVSPGQVTTGGEELLEQWKSGIDGFLWLDIEGPTSDKAAILLNNMFHFDPADVDTALQDRHPPRFDGHDEQFFLLLKMLDSDSHSLDFSTQQMAIFVGENYIVTRHTRESNYLAALRMRLMKANFKIDSSYQLSALLANRMVTRYGNILLELEQRLDVLEDELLESPSDRILQELLGYNTALRKMRRILNYHLSVLNSLNRHVRKQGITAIESQCEQISEEAERFNSLAELYQNVITDLIEGYISLNSHQLNQVMRVLTVVTVLFLPLGLLVGVYGMNFENMPELKSQNGYYVLLGFMGFIVSTLIFFFHRKRWL